MKKTLKILCITAVVLIAFIMIFQIQTVSLGNGEKRVIFTIPLQDHPIGGSAYNDFMKAFVPIYGEDNEQKKILSIEWEGENATLYDTSHYHAEYLGQAMNGDNYYLFRITTERTIIPDHNQSHELLKTSRTSEYVGCDEANNRVRAYVLWDTLHENFSDDEAYFYHLETSEKA